MYCRNCGKKLPDGTKYCLYCGASLITADDDSDLIIPSGNVSIPVDPIRDDSVKEDAEETENAEPETEPEQKPAEGAPVNEPQDNPHVSLKDEFRHMGHLLAHPFDDTVRLNGLIIPASIFIHGYFLYNLGISIVKAFADTLTNLLGTYSMFLFGSYDAASILQILKGCGYTYSRCLLIGILITAIMTAVCMAAGFCSDRKADFYTMWQKASTWLFLPELFLLLSAFVLSFSLWAGTAIALFAFTFFMIYLIRDIVHGIMPAYAKVLFICAVILLICILFGGFTAFNITKALETFANSSSIWG